MRLLLALFVMVVALVAWLTFHGRTERAQPAEPSAIARVPVPIPETLAPVEQGERAEVRVELPPERTRGPAVEPWVEKLAAPAPNVRCTLVGRVLDDEGVPVEDALVTLAVFGTGAPATHGTVHTDAGGHFVYELPEVIQSSARVKLAVSGTSFHAPAALAIPGPTEKDPRVWTEGPNNVGDFVLVLSGVMRGRVIDSMGAPIESATIELSPAPNGRRPTLTTPKGVFRLRDLPEGKYAIEARAAGYVARPMSALEVRVGEETIVPDIVLASAPSIRGIVVDDEGRPVERVRIGGRAVRTGEESTTSSKPDGSFVLFLPGDGLTVLGADGDERGYEHWGGTDGPGVTFSAGASDVRIVLEHLPRMRFVVVDGSRAPIERFKLGLSEARDGTFDDRQETVMLGNHPRGEVRLPLRTANRVAVSAPKFVPVELPIAADAAGGDVQTIQLVPASTISGRLRVNGTPIANGSVSIEPERVRNEEDRDSEEERRTQLTKKDGTFAFDELGAGTYTLRAKGAGGSPKTMPGIVVTSEQHLQLGDIDLDPAALVRGVVLTDARESATHFFVKLDERPERVIPTKDARFEFKDVTAGAHTLVWSRERNSGHVAVDSHTENFVIAGGETRDLAIDARPSTPCSIAFRVLRNGVPVPDVTLRGSLGERRARSQSKLLAKTDANGNATVYLEPNPSIRVEVVNDWKHRLGEVGRMLALVPGGSLNEVIHIETGRLVVELHEGLSLPNQGRIMLWFAGNVQPPSSALTLEAARDELGDMDVAWTSRTIDFGEYAAGSYDVSLSFSRLFRDTGSSHVRDEQMRPMHDQRIEIRNGAVTRIVVP